MDNKCDKFSRHGFVFVSIVVFIISVILFYFSGKIYENNISGKPFSNLLFATALALYLGIFEGWDSLRNMYIFEKRPYFSKNYRWWNFLQICYPLVFFFLVGMVDSEIFTFGLMVAFAAVSTVSMVIWKHGGEKESYLYTNWGRWKVIFGCITVILVFANRIFVMSDIINLKNPPAGLNADGINVELIVVLLGVLNWMFIFWGFREDAKKRFVLMGLPLKAIEKYEEFSEFCRFGFIYDFCNYIYLIYILVVHVLLFSTGFLPKRANGSEAVATILIMLMVIVYVFLSFKAKYLNNTNKKEEQAV